MNNYYVRKLLFGMICVICMAFAIAIRALLP